MDGPQRLPFPYRTGCPDVSLALTGAAQLRADGISSCCYGGNVHNHPSWAMSRKEGIVWYSSRPMPSLWFFLAFGSILSMLYWKDHPMVPSLNLAPHPLFSQLEIPLVTLNLLHRGKKTLREGWKVMVEGGRNYSNSNEGLWAVLHFYVLEL